jgi:hypothetical protein
MQNGSADLSATVYRCATRTPVRQRAYENASSTEPTELKVHAVMAMLFQSWEPMIMCLVQAETLGKPSMRCEDDNIGRILLVELHCPAHQVLHLAHLEAC